MDVGARESFLAAPRVGVLAVERSGRAPVLSPIWYGYELGGDVTFVIAPSSEKAAAITAAGVASLCAQSEQLPYAFVTVSGPVTIVGDAPADVRVALAVRYLGDELGAAYVESTKGVANVLVTLIPKTWRSNDFANVTF
jgi:nitroimidazol reductase NimA-like FMN-containing flavoprotein (pyridoxamine 5'-phosphate oxidase superfamily)